MTEEETNEFLEETCGLNLERWGLQIRPASSSSSTRSLHDDEPLMGGVDLLDIPGRHLQ
jgi:hypothetical protein